MADRIPFGIDHPDKVSAELRGKKVVIEFGSAEDAKQFITALEQSARTGMKLSIVSTLRD